MRVMVADARALMADAMAALISTLPTFAVTGVVRGEDPTRSIAAQKPDVVVVGVSRSAGSSLELVRTVRASAPTMSVVIVADELEPDLVRFVLDQSVNGLLLTDGPVADFAACLDQVVRGHAVLPAGWQTTLSDECDEPLQSLSCRQREVLELLAEGYSYEEIAGRLFISVNTVKFHVRSIFSHLGVRNRMAAARLLAHRPREIAS
jgi:DNA-binding NarL/FixJ family response regulator